MSTAPLLDAADLVGFPGAPFPAAIVSAVGAEIRAGARWHIAPSTTATVTVNARGGALFLKTLQLTDVTSITDVTDPADPKAEDLEDWDWITGGVIEPRRWRRGTRFEVAFTHGYDTCPPDLLLAAAALCSDARIDKATGSVRLGSLSINGAGIAGVDAPGSQVARTVGRYRIPGSR